MSILSTVLDRIREPSSWSGIAILLSLFGLSHEEAGAITNLLAAGAATASVFVSEKGRR